MLSGCYKEIWVCLTHMYDVTLSESLQRTMCNSFHLFFSVFVQKQPHYLLMTLIPGKSVKTLQLYRWSTVGIASIAGVEQSLGTDAVQQLCPCGARGLSDAPHCSGHSHKPILCTPPVAYHRTWINRLIFRVGVRWELCVTYLNNTRRKR